MILGFSTGCSYKFVDSLTNETLLKYLDIGANAVEIHAHDNQQLQKLKNISREVTKKFEFVSIHTPPKESYAKGNEIFNTLIEIVEILKPNNIVLHPDNITDWDTILECKVPWAIENMDELKIAGHRPDFFENLFGKMKCNMVLDLQHVYTHDKDMLLANEFKKFSQINQIHFSGYHNQFLHHPIHKTIQPALINALKSWKHYPIIIESVCDDWDEVQKELEFIKNAVI